MTKTQATGNFKKYRITWVSWNSSHPASERLGYVWARSDADARLKARREWPCGANQEYQADQITA